MGAPSVYNVWYGSYSRLCRQHGHRLDRVEAAAAWRAVKASPIEFSKWRRLADTGSADAEPKTKKRKRKAKDVGEGASQPSAASKQSKTKAMTMQDHLRQVAAPVVYLRPPSEADPSAMSPHQARTIAPVPMRHRSPDDHMVPPISHLLRGKLRHAESSESSQSTTHYTTAENTSKRDTSLTSTCISPPSLEDLLKVPTPVWSLEQFIRDEYLM